MVCPTCGLDNDPTAVACARCNTTLSAATSRPPPSIVTAYRRTPRNLLPVKFGLSVVVLIALVVGIVIYRNERTDPPVVEPSLTTADPASATATRAEPATALTVAVDPLPQARVIDAVLESSTASRIKLKSAIARVGRCTDLAGAIADMRAVGGERRAQIAKLRDADLSALEDGETLRSVLVTALQHSLDADEAYVNWAELAGPGGCGNSGDRQDAYARGTSASELAGTAKDSFLADWNVIAARLGMPARSRQEI